MASQTGPPNRNLGRSIEEYRAKVRNGEHRPDVGYFDVEDRDGTPVEVKSTKKKLPDGDTTRNGRYQLIGDHHETLVEHGGEYDFVLRDLDGDEIETKTVKAEKVDEIIRDAGLKWPNNSKLKLTWTDIHDLN